MCNFLYMKGDSAHAHLSSSNSLLMSCFVVRFSAKIKARRFLLLCDYY